MESNNIFQLAVAFYKDKVQQGILEEFLAESERLMEADVNARREKAREDIYAIADLRIALTKFKQTYDSLLRSVEGDFPSINEYIRQIEADIKRLSYKKNKGHFSEIG